MRAEHAALVDRLRDTRWLPLLRLIDDAGVDDGPVPAADPDAVEPYRWLLARIGDGIRLTQAGYLPPAVVEETMRALGWDADWIGAMNREDQTYPVWELRESARRMGLVRKHRGVLHRTVAGRRLTEDPAGLWWHLADHLPLARADVEQLAGVLFLLAVAARRPRPHAVVAEGLAALGLVDSATGEPPDEHDAFALTRDTGAVFGRLGLLSRRSRDDARPTAGAVQLTRAALLGRDALETPAPRTAAPGDRAVELTVVLRDTQPPIWRRIVVPASLSLRQLHAVLQTAMGWEDYHLHLFDVGGVLYGDVEDFPGELGDEETFTVGEAAAVAGEWRYQYDFGDGWDHVIRVGQRLASVGTGTPHCVDGARACPPEDCGGVPGYEHLLEVLADPADPADPEHADLLEWVGGEFDPDRFDLAATNELLQLYDRHTRRRTQD